LGATSLRNQSSSVETGDDVLEWTEFPGPQPFVGCTKPAGRPISPACGHRLLAAIGDPSAELDYIGGPTTAR